MVGDQSSPTSTFAISSTVSDVVFSLSSTTISWIVSAPARDAPSATSPITSSQHLTRESSHDLITPTPTVTRPTVPCYDTVMNPAEVATAPLIEKTLHDCIAYGKLYDLFFLFKQKTAYEMISVVPWGDNKAMVRC